MSSATFQSIVRPSTASKACGAKTQVLHVFMNLLVNSAHALKSKSLGRPPQITDLLRAGGRAPGHQGARQRHWRGPEQLPRLSTRSSQPNSRAKEWGLG